MREGPITAAELFTGAGSAGGDVVVGAAGGGVGGGSEFDVTARGSSKRGRNLVLM